jgi:hypothetical protein
VAKRTRIDMSTKSRLDEFERRLFLLKLQYEKYFSGIERIEPVRERDDVKRMMRDISLEPITNGRQRFRFQNLRARHSSLDLYLTRNLVQIERGTHPKMKFRADLHERQRKESETRALERTARREAADTRRREERAYSKIYDSYIEARRSCGQSTDLEFDSVKKALKKQVGAIKSRYRCDTVNFRVTIEDGRAKLKAVPKRTKA